MANLVVQIGKFTLIMFETAQLKDNPKGASMDRPYLPDARADAELAFTDADAARTWIAALPTGEPGEALAAVLRQVGAIDAAGLPAPRTVALLNLLRTAALPRLADLELGFARKPLPMAEGEAKGFSLVVQFWTRIGMAYLRPVPHCTPANRCVPLLRAASAFRLAQRAHFLAARSCPALFDQLLIAALSSAKANDVAHKVMGDPDFPRHGNGTIAGQVAWAFLLRAVDPYHLTALQLAVVERALGRWRELAIFRSDRPKAAGEVRAIDLASVTGSMVPEGFPRWLDIGGVTQKIARRIELLEDGEPPGSLKLGRELSAGAVIRLLADVDRHLRSRPANPSQDSSELQLAFGPENVYAVLTGTVLNAPYRHGPTGRTAGYQQMAIYGTILKETNSTTERWTLNGEIATRGPQDGAPRVLAPCLVAAEIDGSPRLGIATCLRGDADGTLWMCPVWCAETVEAGSLKQLAPQGERLVRVPAFVLAEDSQTTSLIVPPGAGIRLRVAVEIAGTSIHTLVPTAIVERGADFIRYACTRR